MRPFSVLVLLFALAPPAGRAQTAFHDALRLDRLVFESTPGVFRFDLSGENRAVVFAALRAHATLPGTPSEADIREAYEGNPFLARFFSGTELLSDEPVRAANAVLGEAAGLRATIGGLNVTNVADGLAQFLVDRARAELSVTFFRRFRKTLSEQRTLGAFFPQTVTLLGMLEDHLFRLAPYQATLQDAFRRDLDALPAALEGYLRRSPALRDETVRSLAAGAFLLTDVVRGTHPADVLDRMVAAGLIRTPTGNLENALAMLHLVAQSLRATDGDRRWVSPRAMQDFLTRRHTLTLYAGFLWQRSGDLRFRTVADDTVTSREALEALGNELAPLGRYAETLVAHGDWLHTRLAAIRARQQAREDTFDDYAGFVREVLDLLTDGLAPGDFPGLGALAGREQVTRFLTLARQVNALVLDLRQGRYVPALVNGAAALGTALRPDSLATFRAGLLRYGAFMASVAEARTPDDVRRALDAFALPAGSAALKKFSTWSVTLNAYLGAFVGDERLTGVPGNKKLFSGLFSRRRNLTYGMTAPVGFALSYGLHRKDHGAVSLFVSLLDVGAVTAFRVEDPDTESLPEIRLENLFAPGLHLVYGFPKWPLSAGFGVQLGPGLRKVTNAALTLDETAGFRTGFFLAVDLPLLSLYAAPRD